MASATIGTFRGPTTGCSFYEVPVTITGLTTANKPYRRAGRLTLRRVNDVAGAMVEQLRWHIERTTLQP